ncbi:uncharacterized protein LOC127831331 [Dreissena polymorpha]|uniref:uncharacterized protein LOC127831331 n=1 Tax=Dreissena polymorpha TaxID=45954 RepID=UPI0022656427|nr:uncharacterized protein LOC127831331 [Dreissena polymorpha]
MEKQLKGMGMSDLATSLISAVCSNFHLVELPVLMPPVPRTLNSEGSVLDLNAKGNGQSQGGLGQMYDKAYSETIDPATSAIQKVTQRMTAYLRNIAETDLAGYRKGDKYLTSIITNGLTNLAAKSQFINEDTKIDLIKLSEQVGTESMEFPTDSAVDVSALIDTSAGGRYINDFEYH